MIQTKTLLSSGAQVAICALLLVSEGRAQIANQAITGTVVDVSGAVVPESVVTLTNEATRAERQLTSGDNGEFNFQGLTPGTCSLKIEKTGFRAVVQTGLRLEADQRLALGNISLPWAKQLPHGNRSLHNQSLCGVSLMKNFQLGKNETRRIRFRAEAYNLFNHTQFMTINSAARFDGSGNQINTQLGQPTADRQPRILQLAATLYF